MNHLKNIYKDPSQGGSFGGVNSLYAEAKKRGVRIFKKIKLKNGYARDRVTLCTNQLENSFG